MQHFFASCLTGALLVWAGLVATAHAQDTLPLTLRAAYAVQNDDNLLRLPEDSSVSGRADRVGVSTLGLQFRTLQGLQQFTLDASLVNYRYEEHSNLGYTARNFAANWQWAVTPRLRGTLAAQQQERPAGSTGDTAPNPQSQSTYRAQADYEVDGPWHVLAGVSRERVSNETDLTAGQDYSSTLADGAIRYESASGSYLQAGAQRAEGRYLNASSPASSALDPQFQQQEQDLRMHWVWAGQSALDARVAWFQRTHPLYPQRDFRGTNWSSTLHWDMSEKTAADLGLQHELAAFATATSNFSVTDRLRLGWWWRLGSKTQLRLQHDLARVTYQGSPLGQAESSRTDHTRDSSIALTWQPATAWSVSTEWRRQVRSSSETGLDYTSNQLQLSGQFTY